MLTEAQRKKLINDAKIRKDKNLRVFIVGGGFQYIKMFEDAGFKGARCTEDADLICFTGGSDVSPNLYGEAPIAGTYFDPERDDIEGYIYGEATALSKPMVGICRGGQFLNVMEGGSLWQDVNNHAIRGRHGVLDSASGEVVYNMTSTHHQMMIPSDKALVLATAKLSTVRRGDKAVLERDEPEQDDIEVVWYEDNKVLCFQPHPEFEHGDCRNYFLKLLDEYIVSKL